MLPADKAMETQYTVAALPVERQQIMKSSLLATEEELNPWSMLQLKGSFRHVLIFTVVLQHIAMFSK